MFRKLVSLILIGLMAIGQIGPVGTLTNAQAADEQFVQTDWSSGVSSDTAVHPTNETGWTKYSDKDDKINSSVPGKVFLDTESFTLADTSDIDFNKGTKNNVTVSGSGADAALTLQPGLSDHFANQLGKFVRLTDMPYMGRTTALVKVGNYVYAVWERNVFGRYSITNENWEMVADLPASAGVGVSLAYPGTGNYIYALRGGGQKTFWRYTLPDAQNPQGVWTQMANTTYPVYEGGSIAASPTKIFCVPGRTAKFIEYDIATNTWVDRPDIYNGWTPYLRSQLVYPGTGNYVYFARGIDTGSFAAYHITKQRWDDIILPLAPSYLADLCYPGTGDYLYGWDYNSGKRFSRFKFQGSGSGVWEPLKKIPIYVGSLDWKGILYYPGSGDELKFLWSYNNGPIGLTFNTTTLKWNALSGLNTDDWYPYTGSGMAYDGSDWIYYSRANSARNFARYSISGDIWETKASVPFAVEAGGDLVYFNNKLYLMAGYNTTNFAVYDPAVPAWTDLSSTLPIPYAANGGGAMAVAEGAIYAFRGADTANFWKYTEAGGWVAVTNPAIGTITYSSATGLNDMTTAGTYDGSSSFIRYRVQIDGTSNPNTFRWSEDNGSTWIATAVPITGGAQSLSRGITITFGATTGHTTSTYWNFNAYTMAPETISTGATLCYPGLGQGNKKIIYAVRTTYNKTLWTYDIDSGLWSTAADLPIPTGSQAKMKYPGTGDYIYLFTNNANVFLRYKFKGPGKDVWEVLERPYLFSINYAGISMEAVGDKIYLVGRHDGNSRDMLVYTVSSGHWTEPVEDYGRRPLYYGTPVYVNGVVYFFAGRSQRYIWKYDLAQDKWIGTINTPFRIGPTGIKAVYPGSGNFIYVSEGNGSKKFWKYDFVLNTWTQLANSTYEFDAGAQLAASGTTIYAIAGIDVTNPTSARTSKFFMKYDIGANSWSSSIEQLPSALYVDNFYQYGHRLVYVSPELSYTNQGALYYKSNTSTGFYCYDIERDTWIAKTAAATSYHGSIYYPGSGDSIYYFSGSTTFFKYSINANTWSNLSTPPFGKGATPADSAFFYPGSGDFLYLTDGRAPFFARYSLAHDDWDLPVNMAASNLYDNKGVACGGTDGNTIYMGGSSSQFWKYAIDTRIWSQLTSPPVAWDEYGAQLVSSLSGDYVYATRGRNRSNFYRYITSSNSWENLTSPSSAFGNGHTLVATPARIFCLRGDNLKNFWSYDPITNSWSTAALAPAEVSAGASACYMNITGQGQFIYTTRGNKTSDFWRYSLVGNSWEILANVPVALGGGYPDGTTLTYPGAGDYIYLTQGTLYDNFGTTASIFRYSISGNSWEEVRFTAPSMINAYGPAGFIYPGSGDYFYCKFGEARYDWAKFLVLKRGSYISDVKIIGRNQAYDVVNWVSNVGDSAFEFKARSSDNFSMSDAPGWDTVPMRKRGDDLTSSYPYIRDKHKYLQYQIKFFADDLDNLPTLSEISLKYNKYPPALELVSSAYNTTEANNRLTDILWSQTQPAGSDIRMQLRTAPDDNGSPGVWTPWLGPGGTQTFNDNYSNENDYALAPTIEITENTAKLKKIFEDFLYTQRIVLDNSDSAVSYTNTILMIEVDSKNYDFWQHVKSDASDVRFSDGNGNLLDYNLTGGTARFDYANKYMKVFVKIPSISAAEKLTIYLKYGKADAVSTSNPDLVSVPVNGLVGWWRFDENQGNLASDSSGLGNTGTLVGAPTWTAGKNGYCLDFSGNNYVDIPSSPSLNPSYMTFAAWVYPRGTGILINKESAYECEIGASGGLGSYHFNYAISPNWTWYNGSNSDIYMDWKHVVVTWDGLVYKTYINGVLETTNDRTDGPLVTNTAGSVRIAARGGSGAASAFFNGKIDEVAFYNRPLTDAEVIDLYAGGGNSVVPYYFVPIEENLTSPTLTGWQYRQEIEIDNRQGQKLIDYQAKISLSIGNENLWSRSKINGFDLRFIDSDNITVLNHYRQSFDPVLKIGVLWVKIPLVAAGEVKRIYLYYGRADAADVSSFNNTMTKNFGDRGYNSASLNLDGIDDKVAVASSNSLNTVNAITLQAEARFDIDYWPDGWSMRKKMTVDTSNIVLARDYGIIQVDVTKEPEMKADYTDIRIWDSDHSQKLKYYTKSSDGAKATLLVEVPNLTSVPQRQLYVYYGNSLAAAEQNSELIEITDGLLGYWKMDEGTGTSVANSISAQYNGTQNNATWVDGISGKALSFNGTNSFVVCNNTPVMTLTNEVTMSAWVKTLSAGAVVTKDESYYPETRLLVSGSRISSYIRTPATNATVTGSISTVNDNKWHHLVMTRKDGGDTTLYVDGKFEARGVSPTGLLNDTSLPAVNFGRQYYAGAYSNYFSGVIDEVKIYNRELTANEVSKMSYAGIVFSPSVTFSSAESQTATLKWLPGFGFRKKIFIDASAVDYTQTLGYIPIEIDYIEGKMKPDYSDIRFVDSDGSELQYRIYESSPTKVKAAVRIPALMPRSRKEIILYYGNASALSKSSPESSSQDIPRNGLKYWWKFDEGSGIAYDSINNVAGTLAGAAEWVTNGKFGNAIKFNGANGSVTPGTNTAMNDNNKTLACWFNPDNFSGDKVIVGKTWYTNPTRTYGAINLNGNILRGTLVYESGTSTTQPLKIYLDVTLSQAKTWYHVALVHDYDNNMAYMYLNGEVVASASITGYGTGSSCGFKIGAYGCGDTTQPFGGLIDQVCYYTRALNALEVNNMYLGVGEALPYTFGDEESQPAVNSILINKDNAYGLKFDDAGLSGYINGSRVISTVDYNIKTLNDFAFTYNGSAAKIYIDGIEKVSQDVSGQINSNSSPLVIGEGLKGNIDEIKIWNTDLGSGRITEFRQKYLVGNEDNLAAYLPLNEGSGTSAADLTSNANNGTLENGIVWGGRSFAYSNEKPSVLYHMDEGGGADTQDASGYSNTLSLNGAVWSNTDLTGFSTGKSLNFDGFSAYAQANDNTNSACTDKITLETWIKPTDNTSTHTILVKGDDAQNRYNYKLAQSGASMTFSFYNGTAHSFSTSSFIVPNTVYHIAATYNQVTGVVKIYKDGQEFYSGSDTTLMLPNADKLYVGRDASGAFPFAGLIDEVRIYRRELNAQEVKAHFDHRLNYVMVPAELLAYEPEISPEIAAYADNNPVIQPVFGVFYSNKNVAQFQEVSTKPNNTNIKYQLSIDGYSWLWFNGTSWVPVEYGYAQANTAQEVNTHLASYLDLYPSGDLYYRAFMHTDPGIFRTPILDNVGITLKTGDTYYTLPEGNTINSVHSDAVGDQWVQYKVMMYSDGEDTSTLDDTSLSYINSYVNVLTPNGGEEIASGSTYNITWNSQAITGPTGLVKLEYSADDGGNWNLIHDNVANTGTYAWQVPDIGTHSCIVKVTSVDFPTVLDVSDATFTILVLELTQPNGAEIIEQGRQYDIKWSTKGSIPGGLIKLEYSIDNGGTWTTIADSLPNNGIYRFWTAPQGLTKESDQALIRISASTDSALYDVSNAVFCIVPQPSITIFAPVGAEEWNVGTENTISWRTNTRDFGDEVSIEYSTDDFADPLNTHLIAQIPIGTPEGAGINSDILGTYQWTIPEDVEISQSVKVRVKEATIPAGRQTQTQVEGISNAFSVIEPSITITLPDLSTIWVKGDTHSITWTTVGLISNNLLFSYKVGGDPLAEEGWVVINQVDGEGNPIGETNDGVLSWIVPEGAVGDQIYIKITDNSRTQVNKVSEAFKVLSGETIIVNSPNGAEELTVGVPYNITWTTYGHKLDVGGSDYNKINISYSIDNGTTWTLIAFNTANTKTYSWNVPDRESTQSLIKIEDANDAENVTDVSDAVFSIIPPSVDLTFPNGGELFYATGRGQITWTSVGAVSNNLTIEYSINGGTSWNTVATGVANTGSYTWDPVADVSTANAKIRITDASRTGNPVTDTSVNVFTIATPAITITSPNGAEQLPIGTFYNITWNTLGHGDGAVRDNLTIQYSSNGGTSWTTIATGVITSSIDHTGSYAWQIPDTVSNACLIKIFDPSRPATADQSDANFRIVLPYIEITSPILGLQWPVGTVKQITWTSVGAISDDLALQYSVDNGSTWKDFSPTAGHIANAHTYNWTIPDDVAPLAKVRLVDNLRPEISDTSDAFTIVNPSIKVTLPNGADLLTVGDTEYIRWENIGAVGSSLKFEYSKDNFASDLHVITPVAVVNNGANATDNYATWVVPNDVSASVRVRITDNNRTAVWDKSDASFTILPVPVITITHPVGGDIWRVGDQRQITWTDNGGKISNNLVLEYSVDNAVNWKPITTGLANSGSYTWTVPDDVSALCKIRITDPSRTPATVEVTDDAFRIADPLITITKPNGAEKWAVGDSGPVTWTTEGSVSNNLVIEYSPDGGSNYYIAESDAHVSAINVPNTGTFQWLVPDNVSSNVLLKIRDGNRAATSDTSNAAFSIIATPRFVNIDVGAAGQPKEFVLGDDVDITWQCEGLNISNNLIIQSSNDDFVSSLSVVATAVSNTGVYSWHVPEDALTGSTLKVRITDSSRTEITGKYSGFFRIRGGFTLTSPNGGEKWVAKSPQTITWNTRGNIPRVKLEYTEDNGTTWKVIAASIENGGSYNWILPDIKAVDLVKVRVSDPYDNTVYDESNNPFSIVYVTVKFNVEDFDTLQHLSDFAVSEPTTGWNDSGLNSPLSREGTYPYGTYTTFFTKTSYIDNSVTWNPPKQGDDVYVITIYLENSASAQVTWEAIFTYSYAPADDSMSAVGSLQRKGKLVGLREDERARMGGAVLTIYEADGTTVRKTLSASIPNSSGMYTFTYANSGFESGKVYPATLTIAYNESNYTSSANIDVGAEKLQYEFFTQTAEKLAASVATIEQAVSSGTSQTRQDIEASRQQLVGDLAKTESAVKTYVSSELSATKEELQTTVADVKAQTEMDMKSEILNTEGAARSNDTIVIRYRTYSGLAPVMDVYNEDNKLVVNKAPMKEINNSGIYEREIKFNSSWGKGTYSIICSEPTKGSLDALAIEVIGTDIDQVSGQVAAILGSTTGLSGIKDVADGMASQFSVIETALSKVSKDLIKEVKDAASSAVQLEPVYSQLSKMAKDIKSMNPNENGLLDKLLLVSREGKGDISYMKNKVQELKAAMEINQKLMDNVANKPVTQTWYEYK